MLFVVAYRCLLLLAVTAACRNLLDSYYLGRVIGAGSFGVVREGIEVSTGRRFAVKTVSKVPKRGAPTPR
jgi:calcium-dependent protein kinase